MWLAGALLLVACEQRGPAQSRPPATQADTAAVVAQLAGCYELRSVDHRYLIHLLSSRSASTWDARLVERENRSGDWWSWLPIDSSRFLIEWGGIDGAREYEIARQGQRLVGQETSYSGKAGGSKATRPVEVRRVSCGATTG
jgi:hypothetical protein